MNKRTTAALALAAVAAVALSGCTAGGGTKPVEEGGDVTLTFLTFETPNLTQEYWDGVIAATNKRVPGVTVKQVVAPQAEGRNQYARQLAATGELPDVMVGIDPSGLAQSGDLAAFSKDEISNWVDPTSNSIDGKIFQLPTNTQTMQVFYNKALFTAAGIEETPKTWDQLLKDSAALKKANISPFIVGGGAPDGLGPRWTFDQIVGNEVFAENRDWLGGLAAGDTSFNDPAFVQAAERISDLSKAGYLDEGALSMDYATAQTAFLDGKGAMYPMGSWFTTAPDEEQQKNIGVFAMPTDDGSLILPAITGGGLSVSAKSTHVDKAKEWAIAFSEVTAEQAARSDGLFIALKDFVPPTDMPSLYNETYALYLEARDNDGIVPLMSSASGSAALPAGFITSIDAGLTDLLAGRANPQQFSENLVTALKEQQQ